MKSTIGSVKMKKESVNYSHIAFSSNLSIPARNAKIIDLSEGYDRKTKQISERISNIIKLIHKTDPLQLMNFLVTTEYFSNILMGSEIEYESEQILQNRAIEYIQSLLVSSGVTQEKIVIDRTKQEGYFHQIQSETIDLYSAIQEWYFYWSAYAEKELELDIEDISYIVESQMFSQVRGNRFQFQVEEHFRTLFTPLDGLLKENYNISANEVIEGLFAIEYSLSQGRGDAISKIQDMMMNPNLNFDNLDQETKDTGRFLIDSMFGSASNDIEKITNWPKNFIKQLSLSLGEYNHFSHMDFEFWPILSLPIQKKPFIEIDGKYYCFAYYNLFDNIYRILQKLLFETNVSNKDAWERIQKETSENAIADIFNNLLPGCKTFRDNYYPEKESLKRMNENDILIKYENSLFIVEVKAGSFSPVPAIINYRSHLNSYKSLVEKADQQCQRTLAYLKRKNNSPIYDKDKQLKETFQMDQYDYIYTFCVTIDDFNEFAAKAEKLNKINITTGTIVISIEDLRTYKDYFKSPFIFLNFLENRKNATQVEALRLTDELDHLGMYIYHNMYPKTISGSKKNTVIQAWGYRQELDEYFMSLWSDEIKERPEIKIDLLRLQLLYLLSEKKLDNKLTFSNFLLDFSTEGAQQFSDSILYLQNRQSQLKRMIPSIAAGEDCRYVIFIKQPEIEAYPFEGMLKYCDGMLAYGKFPKLLLIYINADLKGNFTDLWFEERKKENIPSEKMVSLTEYGKETFETRFKTVLNSSGKKKLGRNDRCPCGSGLKYKKCCGR